MSSPGSAAADCLVCRQAGGGATGGLILDEPLIAAFHVEPFAGNEEPLLGHLLISPRRHVPGLEDLDGPEAAAIGVAMSRLARAVRETFDAERVYSAVAGHHVPHLHVHIYPRHPGTPAGVSWAAADEWEGVPRGGPAEIERLADRLRTLLA
jgi:diadenosine tetraphosphate (Ap4A) HIT family hydrolase